MLLHALLLVLTATAAAAIFVAAGLNLSRHARDEMTALQVESVAESAVHSTVWTIAHADAPTDWQQERELSFSEDGIDVHVTVTPSAGLFDLNTADKDILARALGPIVGHMAAAAAQDIVGRRPIMSYAQLGALASIGPDCANSVWRVATLFSGLSAPDPDSSSPAIARMLPASKRSEVSPTVSTGSVVSGVYRIEVSLADEVAQVRRNVVVDALLTGQINRPFKILDWSWRTKRECSRSS